MLKDGEITYLHDIKQILEGSLPGNLANVIKRHICYDITYWNMCVVKFIHR